MNLAAPFVSQFYSETLNQILPYMDILFANEEEVIIFKKKKKIFQAIAYADTNNLGTHDITEIAKKLAQIPMVFFILLIIKKLFRLKVKRIEIVY